MARRRRRYSSNSFDWPRYVPMAERRRTAEAHAAAQRAKGRELEPVVTPGGRAITLTFWGAAWSANLERCCDTGRLSRGRTYVRNGSVIDLRIGPGTVDAQVCGSQIYGVQMRIEPLDPARWRRICEDCAGGIDSLVELLEGRFADGVMQVLTRAQTGMFPEPGEIAVGCSCPDYATMCKHVVAVLHGIGVRLDERPELLFTLRQVDQSELISHSASGLDDATASAPLAAELAGEDLGAMFGIELEAEPAAEPAQPVAKGARRRGQPAPRKKTTKPSRRERQPVSDPWITAAELRTRGVPPHVFQGWLRSGLLEHSGERGVYLRTEASEALVRRYLARERR